MDTSTAATEALSRFHPLIAAWFRRSVGMPTDVQALAWPRIAAGEHVLACAPTGSGKTLTAFLWAVNRLADGTWAGGCTRVLYVSPLKALNNDIQRNLVRPLAQIQQAFADARTPFPRIGVLTRSGDTSPSERRTMLRRPPEILITTPESLNLMLSSAGGRRLLGHLRTVILDEIHAVLGSRRGVHLMTAVERLVPLAGEFQRIALSATVRLAETAAAFVGGYMLTEDGATRPRDVAIVQSRRHKAYRVDLRCLQDEAAAPGVDADVWDRLAADLRTVIARNTATLIFVRTRSLCERLAQRLNAGAAEPIAYAHHGSLSREVREEVEARMKAGRLQAIIATSTLELGIDIGTLDEVVLVQTPTSVSSAIQRAGRAGHGVDDVSRATFYPTHSHDILESAVLARALVEQDIESVEPLDAPLDVLAQVLISMLSERPLDIDRLFLCIRASYPYRRLARNRFDLVLNMLAGCYAETRLRDLKARVSIDRIDNTAALRPGAVTALYTNGGTIPDRGCYRLRHRETNALIGELDEEYVWEASVGQRLAFGTRTWRIHGISHNDVFVEPEPGGAGQAPFWRGEIPGRDFHFSSRIAAWLERAEALAETDTLGAELAACLGLAPDRAEALADYLRRQRAATRRPLPHRHHLLVEHVDSGPGGVPEGRQLILHTCWGGRVNRPYALALQAAWAEHFGTTPEIDAADDSVQVQLPEPEPEPAAATVLALVTAENVEALLHQCSGLWGY